MSTTTPFSFSSFARVLINFYNTVLSINCNFDCFSGIVELVKKLGNSPFEREDEEVNTSLMFLSPLPKTSDPKVTNPPPPPPLPHPPFHDVRKTTNRTFVCVLVQVYQNFVLWAWPKLIFTPKRHQFLKKKLSGTGNLNSNKDDFFCGTPYSLKDFWNYCRKPLYFLSVDNLKGP